MEFGRVKAIQLKAITELAVRMIKPTNFKQMKINSQSDIADICVRDFYYEKKEIARVYFLNVKNMVMQVLDVSIGGLNYVNLNIKEILAKALELRAHKIILVHNHPSGEPVPSHQDIKFTDELYNAAKVFDIDLLDHIIVAKDKYTSVYTFVQEKARKIREESKKLEENESVMRNKKKKIRNIK